jgi:hypothetical protein
MFCITPQELSNDYNITKELIKTKSKIENRLNVIAVFSNVCNYRRRVQLAKQFVERMQNEIDVNLYIVELVYPEYNPEYVLISEEEINNPNYLRLETNVPLWHKENLINIAVERLLPKDWKAFAWVDVDVEFENVTWATDTLKLLTHYNILQLYSHSLDLTYLNETNTIRNSVGYEIVKNNSFAKYAQTLHPGFAWAINREGYNKINKLIECCIVGGADNILALSLINRVINYRDYFLISDSFSKSVLSYADTVKNLKFGYTPGILRHYFHGSKGNRKYVERWEILKQYKFEPSWLEYDSNGLLQPNRNFPKELLDDILKYFQERNEDEFYEHLNNEK